LCSTLFKESINIKTLHIRNVYYNKHQVIDYLKMTFGACFILDMKQLLKTTTSLKIENIETTIYFWTMLTQKI
jgi:hypothetical protein